MMMSCSLRLKKKNGKDKNLRGLFHRFLSTMIIAVKDDLAISEVLI